MNHWSAPSSVSDMGAWRTFGTFDALFQQTAELFADHDQADLMLLAAMST